MGDAERTAEFDAIARELATGEISRRTALKRFAGASLAAVLASGGALIAPGTAEASCPPRRKCGSKCCPPHSHCTPKGRCRCNSGYTKCSGKCVDLQTNVNNCGSCDHVCASGKTCVGGHCQTTCQQASDCADLTSQCKTLDGCVSNVCQYSDAPGLGQSCSAGVGACERTGTNVCDGNGNVVCSATPGTPTAETCNGIDDDCDGVIDNGALCNTPPPDSCSGGVLTTYSNPGTCNSATCNYAPTQQSCSPYVCQDSTSCYTSCSSSAQCAQGYACSSNVCVPT